MTYSEQSYSHQKGLFMKTTRRQFMIYSAATGLAATMANKVALAAPVAETDPQAVSLGYKADASKVDKAKFPKFAAGQNCGNCSLYKGAAGSKTGPCQIFPGKEVAAAGWCSAYAKKA